MRMLFSLYVLIILIMTGKWGLPWKGHPSSLNYQRRDLGKEQATRRGCRRSLGTERELCAVTHMNLAFSLDRLAKYN